MLTTTAPIKFVSMYINDLSHSFNKGAVTADQEYFPVFHMSNLTNHQQVNKTFDSMVEESMTMAYKYTIVTNDTPYKIHIKDRSNIIKSFPATKGQNNLITIFTIHCLKNPYCHSTNMSENIDNYCKALLDKYEKYDDSKLDEMKIVYKAILENGKSMTELGYNNLQKPITYGAKTNLNLREYIYIVTKVELSLDLLKNNLSLYLLNKDIVASIKPMMEVEEHPSLTDDNPITQIQEYSNNNMFSVVLVDNGKHYTSRYMYMFSEIIEIKPILDNTRKDGLYLFYKINNEPKQLYLNTDEIDKSTFLFKSKEAAITGGDISANYKKQIQELEHSYKQKELEMANQLHNNNLLLNAAKIDLENKKIELNNFVINSKREEHIQDHYYKEKKLRATDYYDERSAKRTEYMEVIKTGASVLTSMVAIFLLARKV